MAPVVRVVGLGPSVLPCGPGGPCGLGVVSAGLRAGNLAAISLHYCGVLWYGFTLPQFAPAVAPGGLEDIYVVKLGQLAVRMAYPSPSST